MTYFISWFLNFLAVFFIARIAPGIEISLYQRVPNIGGSLLFALIIGFFNASVFPALFIFEVAPSKMKIAVITGLISFLAFIFALFVPFGVRVLNGYGVLFGGLIVWGVAFLTNYFEWHRGAKL